MARGGSGTLNLDDNELGVFDGLGRLIIGDAALGTVISTLIAGTGLRNCSPALNFTGMISTSAA